MALGAAAAELARGNPDRAQRLTLQLIKSDPTLPRAFALRGIAFFQAGDFDQAEKHLREALRLDMDNTEAARGVKQARTARGLIRLWALFCVCGVSVGGSAHVLVAPLREGLARALGLGSAWERRKPGRGA